MNHLLLLNGPNMNKLGSREREIYGEVSLSDIESEIRLLGSEHNFTVDCFQSNHEGELVDKLHQTDDVYDGVIFNPAAYAHTSVAIRDAIKAVSIPVIEVHMSNVYAREAFRHTSIVAPVCHGQITGLGLTGYRLAALAFITPNRKGEIDDFS